MLKKLAILLCAGIVTFSGCSNNAVGAESTTKAEPESTTKTEPESTTKAETESTIKSDYKLKQLTMPEDNEEIAVITTDMGEIKIKFFPDEAPKAVENFKKHAKDKYYDNLTFHRVVNNFVIQGGDPDGVGTGGKSIWDTPFEDEFSFDLHNLRGALSMANTGPDSNGSQFFIVQAKTVDENLIKQMEELNNAEETKGMFPKEVIETYKNIGGTPWLDYMHTVFGQVFEGLDIVDKIAIVETAGENNKPVKDVKVEKIEIIKYKK